MILKYQRHLVLIVILLLTSGCATYLPARTDNLCSIFRGEPDWYEAARDSSKRWGTPIWVLMAIINQESRFVADARPPRPWFLFIPLPRSSSAYGYAQAQDPVWEEYKKETGNSRHDRAEFSNAIDFVGWYTHTTQRTLGVSKWDVYRQYLAYHEGWSGYQRGSWHNKEWLVQVARQVQRKSADYNAQLKICKAELDDKVDSWF